MRCLNCEKKISLVESLIKCKCDKTYCSKCRIPEVHNCTYDYKKNQSSFLEKSLIKVSSNKIVPI